MKSKVIDFESPLETAVNTVGYVFLFIGIICLALALGAFIFFLLAGIARLEGIYEPFDVFLHPIPPLVLLSLPFLAMGGLLSLLRSRLDIHYTLDPDREQLMLSRTFLKYQGVRPVAAFADIDALAVGGKFHSEPQGKGTPPKEYWTWALFAVTRNGRKIRLTDWSEKNEWRTQRLDELLGVRLVEPTDSSNRVLVVRRGKLGPTITYRASGELFVSFLSVLWANLGCLTLLGLLSLLWRGVVTLEHWMWG